MKRIVSIILVLIAAIVAFPRVVSAGDFDFPYPVNRLGWSDGAGKLSLWVNGDWRVYLDNGEWLPLRFHFSSMQDRVADGMLGAGWWVPLFESTVVQRSEHSIRMTTLGGQSMYLQADPKKEGTARTYRTRDYKWVGTVGNGGRFDVEGPDSWKFAYRDGRLARVVTPKGKTLSWNYDANKRVKSITGEGGREMLTVKAGGNGLAEGITMTGGSSFDFGQGQYPQVAAANGMTTIAGILPSVNQITENLPDGKIGRSLSFDLKLDRKDGDYKMDYIKGEGETKPGLEKFVWQATDGVLSSDAESEYRRDSMKGGVSIHRYFHDDTKEGYLWDTSSFTETWEARDGLREVNRFIGSPGSNFMKILSKRFDFEGAVKEIAFRYDEHGNVLRKIEEVNGGEKVISVYNSEGTTIISDSGTKNIKVDGEEVTIEFHELGNEGAYRLKFVDGRLVQK